MVFSWWLIKRERSFIETAHREVLEETGLAIRIKGYVNVVSNHLDDLHHTIVIVLIGDVLGGHQEPGDDLTELEWIHKELLFVQSTHLKLTRE